MNASYVRRRDFYLVASAWVFLVGYIIIYMLQSIQAQQPVLTRGTLQPVSHATLSITSSTVVRLTTITNVGGNGGTLLAPTNAVGIAACHLSVETGSIRYWEDGTSPTTTAGHLLVAGDTYDLQNSTVASLWGAIATSTTASVPISCAR